MTKQSQGHVSYGALVERGKSPVPKGLELITFRAPRLASCNPPHEALYKSTTFGSTANP